MSDFDAFNINPYQQNIARYPNDFIIFPNAVYPKRISILQIRYILSIELLREEFEIYVEERI